MVFCGRGGVGGGCGWGLFSDRTNRLQLQVEGGGVWEKDTHGAYAHVRQLRFLTRKTHKHHGERTKTNRPPLLAAALRTPHLTPNAKGDQRLPRGKRQEGDEAEKHPDPDRPPQRC
jgi:hypothetical protein